MSRNTMSVIGDSISFAGDTFLERVRQGVLKVSAWVKDLGTVFMTAALSKVNDTLADAPGLRIPVLPGRSYRVWGMLHIHTGVAAGWKAAFSGSATITSMNVHGLLFDAALGDVSVVEFTALDAAQGHTTAGAVNIHGMLDGIITVNAGGDLKLQFAQNATQAGAASELQIGSYLKFEDITP